MGQIADHVKKRVQEFDRPESNSGDAIEAHLSKLVKENAWPFTSVTPDDFRDTVRPLIQAVYDVYNESGDQNKDKPFELIQDKLHYRIVNMLKCVQAMEFEAKSQEIKEQVLSAQKEEFTPEYDKMYAVMSWAKEEMYRYAEHANAYMKHTFDLVGQTPLDIEEWDKKFIPRLTIDETYKATKAHSQAFHKLADRFDLLLKYGLPSETTMGKWFDENRTVTIETKNGPENQTVAQIKADNEKFVADLVRAQFDIDRIELLFAPKIQMAMMDIQAQAALEDLAIENAGFRGKSSYWEDYRKYDKTLTTVEKAIGNMHDRENKRMQGATLAMSCDKNGVYTLTATKKNGKKQQITVKEGEVVRKKTTEKLAKEISKVFKLTTISAKVRQEKTERAAQIYGVKAEKIEKTHNPDRADEKKKTVAEATLGRVGISFLKKGRLSDERTARMQLTGVLGKLSASMTKTHSEGRLQKEEKVWSGGTEIGGSVTVDMPTKDRWGMSAKAEAHASADAQYKKINISTTMGPSASAGTQINPKDFGKDFAKNFLKEIAKGKNMDLLSLKDQFVDVFKDAGVKTAMNWGKIKIKYGEDFTIAESQGKLTQDEQTQKKQYTMETKSPIVNEVKDMIEKGKEIYGFFYGAEAQSPELAALEKPNAHTQEAIMLDR